MVFWQPTGFYQASLLAYILFSFLGRNAFLLRETYVSWHMSYRCILHAVLLKAYMHG